MGLLRGDQRVQNGREIRFGLCRAHKTKKNLTQTPKILPPDNMQSATPHARVRCNTKARPPPTYLHFGGLVSGEDTL